MILDIFALLVILLLLGVVIWLVVLLGNLPGKIARQRNHPQADAITALGWIGIITMGAGFLVAIIWAYYTPRPAGSVDADTQERITALEEQVQALKMGGADS